MFTTDTRKGYCPIRIVYAEPWRQLGSWIHANGLHNEPHPNGADAPLAIIRDTESSDYSGGAVQVSNRRVLLADPAIEPHLVQIIGSHGYQALAYDATLGPVPASEELRELLGRLENHACIDDDDHSNLECELEAQAWESWGRDEFRQALQPLLDEIDPGHEHDVGGDYNEGANTELQQLWIVGCSELNIAGGSGVVIQTGCAVHFYIDQWVEAASRRVAQNPKGALACDLQAQAVKCRSAEIE